MDMIADILLISGAIGAAVYCMVLARRLRRFTDLEKGVGGAIAVLSVQVDDMTKSLEKAKISAAENEKVLESLTERAENAARRLELLLASLHDLPDGSERSQEIPENKVAPKSVPQDPKSIFLSRRLDRREAAE